MPTWRPAGRLAALVEVDDPPSWAAALRSSGSPTVDVVPGAATVLVVAASTADLAAAVRASPAPPARLASPGIVTLDVVYDGADLVDVAASAGLEVADVVALHAGATYTARFGGFAPGFAYLEGLPAPLRLPRRPSPRARVPAGSVAIADRYSAVYPAASPGGWHLLGRTSARLFHPHATPPALIAPGARVRFRPVDALADPAPAPPAAGRAPEEWLEVLDVQGRALVQDAGRPGHAHLGVPPSGWLDPAAAGLANRVAGGSGPEAVLEVVGSLTCALRARRPRRLVAVPATGAPPPWLVVDGRSAGPGPVEVHPGSTVVVRAPGRRGYLAVSGGLAVPPVLASAATDTLSGLGPPPLVAGATVALGPDLGRRPALDAVPLPAPEAGAVGMRLLPGPRTDWLDGGLERLRGATFTVAADSDRVGLRLDGARLTRRSGELPPEGVVTGSVQLPPSGQPVLFLADHPVTGGYPVVAVVDDRDLHLAAALLPGATVRFT